MSSDSEQWKRKIALVTGASVGIGASVAINLANSGMIVIGIARRIELIAALNNEVKGSGRIHARQCDVTNEAQVLETFKWIKEKFNGLDVLVNNAGINRANFLIDSATEDFKNLFDVNVLSSCVCLREAVRTMRGSGSSGHIIIINSVLGHRIPDLPVPTLSVYPATKHAITALCQTVRREIHYHKLNIKLTSISPGMVDTDFLNCYKNHGMLPKLKSEDVAAAVSYALHTPDHVEIEDVTLQAMARS